MKLNDLKAGRHVVELRNGNVYLVLKNKKGLFLAGISHVFSSLHGYDQSMSCKCDQDYDICKVYSVIYGSISYMSECIQNHKNLIWERDEEKEELENRVKELEKELGLLKCDLNL